MRRAAIGGVAAVALLCASTTAAAPEEASPGGWSAGADLHFALSSGNSRSASLGLDAEAEGGLGRFHLSVRGGGFRASAATVRREAVGAPGAFEVRETVERRVSANRGYFRVRLAGAAAETGAGERDEEGEEAENGKGLRIGPFASAGWERDLPAGIESRYDLTAGVGKRFGDPALEAAPLVLGAGFSFVRQRDVVPDPETDGDTLALRLDARSAARVRAVTLGLDAATVWNLRQRGDLRLDATGSAEAPLSRRLALRTSLQTLFDARPALRRIPLAEAPGGPPIGQVAARRARLDLILFVSLAVRW